MPKQAKNPQVSILIPVYNGADVVSKAIDSASEQTYQNIEIVIVNDGSTDNTEKVLRRYQEQHPEKIKVVSQKNKGLGATRNALINMATGDYIIHLDADDWLKKDYVEKMLHAIGDGDLAICGYECYDSNYQPCGGRVPGPGSFAKYNFCSTAGKIWRREFIESNHLRYEPISIGEDAYFNGVAYSKTNAISTIPYGGYCNYLNNNSMTHQAVYDESMSFYSVMNKLVCKLQGSPILCDPEFQFFVLKSLLVDIYLYKASLSARELIRIYRKNMHWYRGFLRQNNTKLRVRFQRGTTAMINLTVNGFIISTKLHLDWIVLRILKKIPVSML